MGLGHTTTHFDDEVQPTIMMTVHKIKGKGKGQEWI